MTVTRLLVIASFLFSTTLIRSEAKLSSSFDIQVAFKPWPVSMNGNSKLVYELHLTSFDQSPLTLKCVSVVEPSTSKQFFNVCDDLLAKRTNLKSSDKLTVDPGMHAVVYLEFEIPGNKLPDAFKHRVEFNNTTHDINVVESAEVLLHTNPLPVLDPPLAGGPWVGIYEPSWERGHRRVFYATDGTARLPGRFAIDFMKLKDDGTYAAGNEDQITNWYGYGADVLAVANATVASVRDTIQESQTIAAHTKQNLEEGSGNYVALALGNGYFAFYEHLKPGSVRVKTGDRVSSGQKIASLGFTGDSTGPHLHFHVADRNSTLAAEGVPYHFKNFKLLGSYENLDQFGKKRWTPLNDSSQSIRKMEFPAPNTVVMFSD